jgi:hypothetical protein
MRILLANLFHQQAVIVIEQMDFVWISWATRALQGIANGKDECIKICVRGIKEGSDLINSWLPVVSEPQGMVPLAIFGREMRAS